MTISVDAVYEHGQLKLKETLLLAEGTPVRVTITPLDENRDPLDDVIGICKDGPDVSLAERHDEILHGGLLRKDISRP
ncbi:MAG: antitoxin family protein [Planctomycetes bacterium]|nr:antitoxin family protein [Planctomycetota bacterium]